ncbi:MAG: amidase family protein, partial [Acidimicrobiales bacterium]
MTSARVKAEAVRSGRVSARNLTEEALLRIEADNGELNAFVQLDAEAALEQAEKIDRDVANGIDPGALAGVAIGVKELESAAGFTRSDGSLLRKDAPPEKSDSIHVGRLRAAGAVVFGMTASPEFGTAAFTRSRAWGTTRNPWDTSRTPGGSSGGSAAAVASGMVSLSTASDGGGSTRIPASFSGLVGFKSSHGRIPREGTNTGQTAVAGALTTT